ncbi:alkene reductase [Glycomyces mayteni]|uniref:Alkene reductase n=1 Tax=Glycomyces mayteni TaxID=543887 RepID=A0ABW2D881_9ACTN
MTNATTAQHLPESAAQRLFEPVRLGALELPNRMVMAPMTRNRATFAGVPLPLMAEYYGQRATAGLIVGEASTPSPAGFTYPEIAGLYDDAQVEGWRAVADAVHAGGGLLVLQIEHGGRIGHPDNNPGGLLPLAPSAVRLPGGIHTPTGHQEAPVPVEMTEADVKATVGEFAAAARNALRAGADGVEVHAANGYLLNQFLSSSTNRRADRYGGSVANRIRFVVEVAEAVAAEVGAARTGLRISPWNTGNGIDVSDSAEVFPALLDAVSHLGLAYLHIGRALPGEALFGELRRRWAGPLVANPELGEELPIPADGGLSRGLQLLEAGADAVAFGRAFLANPDLVERYRRGAALTPVREDRSMYGRGPEAYTDYPFLSA